MFVSPPDPFLTPAYRISPFQTAHIAQHRGVVDRGIARSYLDKRFGKGNWMLTRNGREAIALAMQQLAPQPSHQTRIRTTSDNLYISSCVTSTLSEFGTWVRTDMPNNTAYLVNHEFGYPCRDWNTDLPVIEDVCTAFFTADQGVDLGRKGDYACYSFPKFFPLQIGGMLSSPKGDLPHGCSQLHPDEARYILGVLDLYLEHPEQLIDQRLSVYHSMAEQMAELGFEPHFEWTQGTVPSVFLFKNQGRIAQLPDLKIWLQQHGIQCSVFYGQDSFFIPCHQYLTAADVAYFTYCIAQFIHAQKPVS